MGYHITYTHHKECNVYQELEIKRRYLVRANQSELINQLDAEVKNYFQHRNVPPALLETLSLAVNYCFIKHIKWRFLPMFQEIVIDFLVQDFFLSKDDSQNIIELLLTKLPSNQLEQANNLDAADFLKFIFIQCISSEGDNAVLYELGLGVNIIKRIRSAADVIDETVAEKDSNANHARFLPDIELQFVRMMLDLAEEQKTLPYAVDVYRLQFLLDGFANSFDLKRTAAVFRVLMDVANITEVSKEWLLTELNRVRESIAADFESASLFKFLVDNNLIYAVLNSNNDKRSRWRLSVDGQRLVAAAFADEYAGGFPFDVKSVTNLDAYCQREVIRRLPFQAVKLLVTSHLDKLCSQGLAVALERLSKIDEEQELFDEITTGILSKSGTPWQKAAVCRVLGGLEFNERIRLILEKVAKSDLSFNVRSAALAPLRKESGIDSGQKPKFSESMSTTPS